jgi:hypothetical protein
MKVIDRVYENNEQDKRDAVALLGQEVGFTDFVSRAIKNIGNEYPPFPLYGTIDKFHGIMPSGYAASAAKYNCIFTLKEIEEYVVFDKDSPPEEVIKHLGKEAQFSNSKEFFGCDSVLEGYYAQHYCSSYKINFKFSSFGGTSWQYMRVKK